MHTAQTVLGDGKATGGGGGRRMGDFVLYVTNASGGSVAVAVIVARREAETGGRGNPGVGERSIMQHDIQRCYAIMPYLSWKKQRYL